MSENTTTPDQPTAPIAEAQTEAPAAAPSKRRGRTAMIAGGATLGALLLVGGGVAIGAAVADDRDDDGFDSLSSSQRTQTASDDIAATTERTDDDAQVAPAADLGAADAAELSALIDAAKGVATGEPTAIDANRDGTWDVTLTAGDGAETEVRISADGSAAVHETESAEADDRAPKNVLDAATLATMVDAALAEQPGRILEIDADDDNRSPFDVSVLTGDRRVIDITLDASGSVIASEIDD
ncbi:PepSY domain-containing protein [Microbacterium sp. 179-I 1D1 NHS]|uniref:PepSY domain-containing protein n=1 Tax=Microbacterium sp. 179-I 1D1 NHS TaxID=3374298 RepID=UPI00387981F8